MESFQNKKSQFFIQKFFDQTVAITQQLHFQEQGYCLRHEQSGQYLAIGCNNGTKHIYSVKQKKILHSIQCEDKFPITSLRWRPQQFSKTKVLVATNSQGNLTHWHIPSGKKLFSLKEENSILCLDYSQKGTRFATSGKDFNIRIYDQSTKSVQVVLEAAQWNLKGHSNRVFALKFIDQHTIISGGWDSVVLIWDVRSGKTIRSIYGPHIAGDALDYQNDKILTGSHAPKDQLQLWDFNTGKLMQNLEWDSKKQIPYIYTAQFGKVDKDLIVAGSSGTNEIKLFKKVDESYKSLNKISNLGGGCYSADFSYFKKQFAFTDSTGRFCNMKYGVK